MEFHDLANVFPMLSDDELNALARDIAENGQRHEITLYQGKIIDGRNRYAACMLAGVEPRYTEYTGDNPVAFVVSENIARRHLDESQRAMCAARLANMKRGDNQHGSIDLTSQSKASEMLNVSVPSVKRAAQVIERGVPELVQAVERGEIAVSKAATIAREPVEVQREIVKTEYKHVSDDSYEWYTPDDYIESARALMGGIDLDPASCDEAQEKIKAGKYYTKNDNGLTNPWHGRVWLNPPYCMPDIENFTGRAIELSSNGGIDQAVILTNNSTDTAWFHRLIAASVAVCFTRGRVKFWGPDGGAASGARQGQAIFYLGDNADGFKKEFAKFGAIMVKA